MPHLDYQKRDGIAYLVMNRPERRNALSPQMIVEMAAAWQDFRDDREARVADGEWPMREWPLHHASDGEWPNWWRRVS